MHEVLVNRLGGLSLPRKSVVRLTDRPDMTLDVYRGRKTTIQKKKKKKIQPKHFEQQQVSRAVQVLHTRVRLECSSLNYHLYQKNLVDSPLCSCGQIDTTTHYFLHCPNYLQPRQDYFSALPYQLTLSLLLNGLQDVPTEVNNMIFKQVQLYIIATKRF